eukprot:3925302-Prymnesium_polylepis.1
MLDEVEAFGAELRPASPPAPPSPPPPPVPPPQPALSYRLVYDRTSHWAWDLRLVNFFDSQGVRLMPSVAIESGSYGGCVSCSYGANNAIFNSGAWGGRRDVAGNMWIGATWTTPPEVASISF